MRYTKSLLGFTLIEMLVVVGVIGMLATMALFALDKSQAAARDAKRVQIMTSAQSALERYYSDNLTYVTNAAPDFCLAAAALALGTPQYLPAIPSDPLQSAGSHICVGPGGNNRCCTSTGCVVDNTGASCAGAWYGYTSTAQSYTLTLKKESGGTQTFTNP